MGSSVGKVSKSSNDYEFWEKASIEFDIAIDEQDEEACDNIIECPEGRLKKILKLGTKDKDRERFWRLIIDRKGNVKIEVKVRGRKPEDKFWTAFFLAKKFRAKLLSENNDTQLKKLDWVVDFLIKKAASQISEDSTFQYLLPLQRHLNDYLIALRYIICYKILKNRKEADYVTRMSKRK